MPQRQSNDRRVLKQVMRRYPQMRFSVDRRNEQDIKLDKDGFRISGRGFYPTFTIDEALDIAKKFNGVCSWWE